MGIPRYDEDFVFLTIYFSAQHYLLNRSTFCVPMKSCKVFVMTFNSA